MIKSDIRKTLTTVDISQYDSVIETYSERLKARNLAENTALSYIACLKIFFAWCVLYLASKAAMTLDYEDFRAFIAFLEQIRDHLQEIRPEIAQGSKCGASWSACRRLQYQPGIPLDNVAPFHRYAHFRSLCSNLR